MKDPSQVRVTGPLGPYAKGFRAELAGQGYASSRAVNQLKLVGHLSRWMTIEGLSAPELVPVEIERYVAARRAARYRHNLSEQGLRPLLEYLRGLGVLAGPAPSSPATPHERLLEDYASYLVAERSLASGTVRYYLRFARLFVSSVSDETGLGLGAITTGDVSRFVVEQCGRRSVGSARTLVMALRSLLRFLHVTGLSATPLAGAVPAVAPWRERSLPQGLSPAAVARLLGSCDQRGATGRRDYAILVVLLRLGLRAGEAAALELDDIDWRRGELVVRGKGDRREQLPLPVDVGEALAAYLRRGRPRCQDRHLFLRVKAPTAGLKADGVTKVVHAACRRAGLPVVGAHRLRRTNACATLRRGGSLAEVGEILRQRSAFTQALYAKVGPGRARARRPSLAGRTVMSVLGQALEDYLRLRRALGFKLECHGRLLPSLVSHLESAGAATVTTQLALTWATAVEGKPGEWAIRLSIARGFAAYLQGLDPATEVPPADLLPRTRRRASPYLYTEAEIAALMNATRTLRFPLNRATYKTVIGLLATTGMRIGELITLDRDDLDREQRTLLVRNAKFADTRLRPLHKSTTAYADLRDELCPQAGTPAFFVSTAGTRLAYANVYATFQHLVRTVGLEPRSERCHPRLHDFRHYADGWVMRPAAVFSLAGAAALVL